jgi:hypothetical protein
VSVIALESVLSLASASLHKETNRHDDDDCYYYDLNPIRYRHAVTSKNDSIMARRSCVSSSGAAH